MSASDEFPRGFDLQTFQDATAAQASIVVPSNADQSIVVTTVTAYAKNFSTTAVTKYPIIEWLTSVAGSIRKDLLVVPAGQGADSLTWTGSLQIPPGETFQVITNIAPGAGSWFALGVQGYYI